MQQQLQSAANGRTGDPGSGKWRLRSNTLGSINGGVHLQIYPCFFKRNMIWTKLPNLYFLWCSMWHLQGWNQNSNSISKLEDVFVDPLCRPMLVGLVLIYIAFITLFLQSYDTGGFTCHHLPRIPLARLRTPWLRRTPMRRPKGVKLRVFSPGVQLLQIALHAFFWCTVHTCVAAGYFHVLVKKYAAWMSTNNIMINML